MDKPTLASRLQTLREYSGMSARVLSELAGLQPTHFALIESGERPHPAAETMVHVARILGTTVEWLVTGEGRAPTEREVRAAAGAAYSVISNDSAALHRSRKPRRSRRAAA